MPDQLGRRWTGGSHANAITDTALNPHHLGGAFEAKETGTTASNRMARTIRQLENQDNKTPQAPMEAHTYASQKTFWGTYYYLIRCDRKPR
jgi:hypothetical protein